MSEKMVAALNALYKGELEMITKGVAYTYTAVIPALSSPPKADLYGMLNTANEALKRMGERPIRLIIDGSNNRFEVSP